MNLPLAPDDTGETQRFDVIVVGAGAAGGVVAARLSEEPDRTVLLLEAGPDFADEESMPGTLRYGAYSEGTVTTRDFMWEWQTTPSAPRARGYRLLTGKALGGGSSVNGQVWLRGLPQDFDGWSERHGLPTWGWNDVAPWFAVTETDHDFPGGTVHGHSGPVHVRRFAPEEWHAVHRAFHQACAQLDFPVTEDLNAPGAVGVGAQPFNNFEDVRQSSAITHLFGARRRANLTIRGGHEVIRIRFEGSRAVGVDARDPDGAIHPFDAEQIVLSAGAIGSPWLLLRSGIGPAAHLVDNGIAVIADLPGVGSRLQDHPRIGMRWATGEGVLLDPTAARYQVSLRTTSPGSSISDDLKISMTSYSHDDLGVGIEMYTYLMFAESLGTVRLRSGDPDGPPDIDFRFFDSAEDRRRMREGLRLAFRIAQSPLLTELLVDRIVPTDDDLASDEALDSWIVRDAQGTFHPSSTCAMGPSADRDAVVDAEGRVHGIDGLRVIDASILPDSVRANLTATVFMLAERIAAGMRAYDPDRKDRVTHA